MTVSIDENALKTIAALQRPGKPDLLTRIVDLFKSESPKTIANMLEGINVVDMEAVRVAAHALKSSSAYVGALALSERCKELESAAHDQNFTACIVLGDSVEELYHGSCEALDLWLRKAA